MQTWIATYFTILTAYLITAYVAGIKLTRSQVSIIYGGFVVLGGLCAFGATGAASRLGEFTQQVTEVNPQRDFLASTPVSWAVSAVLFTGLLAAWKFMGDVRHPKTD